ncbi:MAG: hypothetical protein ABH886_04550 [Candidatus Desantisbacteria bacterium]
MPVKTQQLKLVPGWNLIGLSAGTTSGRLLGSDILYQDGTCTTIQSWQNGAWKTFRFDLGFGDKFDIESGRGYFAYCNEGSIYSPNRITLSNVGSSTAAISYVTWDTTSSWLKYGTASLSSLAYDVRGENQLTTKHYISLTNLAASTTYYYDIITSGLTDDNNGEHYSFKTGAAITSVTAVPVSGRVSKKGGSQAEDAIVYVRLKDTNATGDLGTSGWISTRTNSSGVWSIDINIIRRLDGIGLFRYSSSGGDTIEVWVDGSEDGRGKASFDTSKSNILDVTLE